MGEPAEVASQQERQQSPTASSSKRARTEPAEGDVFDQDGFDAISYINEMFPTESSLVGLDPLIKTLRTKIKRLDSSVLSAVRQQSSSGSRARQDLANATSSIEELFGKISDIRRKAEQSEVMVQEICRDIKKLDHAKKHLTHTITALRRFAMLVNAVDQLQTAVERGEFGEAAHLVEAVQQLNAHFQGYAAIPKVAELGGRVHALQTSLQIGAAREFELLGTGEETPSTAVLDRLKACCALTDALGPKARDEVIDSICRKEIGVYSQIFSGSGDTAALDRTERRYLWLRNRLAKRAAVWAIFPEAWRLPHLLCLMFCSITKAQLAQSLDAKAAELPNMVEALLMAVKATNDFEAEMARRFGGGAASEEESPEEAEDEDAAPASAVRQRYERMFKERQRGEEGESPGPAVPRNPFQGAISSIFSRHLKVYVEAEERGLREQLETLMREETWQPMEDAQQTRVLRSASAIFAVIKKSLQRCSKYVSRGEALLQLLGAFQRVLKAYAGKLYGRLPKTAAGTTTAVAAAGSTDWQVKVSDEDMTVICTIIASAEYCVDVVASLGRSVAKTLEPPFNEMVDVSEEEDEFQTVISGSLNVLLLAVETRLDAPLQQMLRQPWANLEAVGDQSEFVNGVSRVMAEAGQRLGLSLTSIHFRFFCDKLASSFCPRYFDYIFRCKKIGEAGSQQLLLDTQAIKGLLLELPTAGKPDEAVPPALAGYINREMAKAEALLKVVGSRPENLADNFATLLPSASAATFQRILELKVMKRQEQLAVTEAFNKRLGGRIGGISPVPASAKGPGGVPLMPTTASPAVGGYAGPAGRSPGGATSTQDFAARFRFGGNSAAARATAAGERMRETMAGSLAAMKNLNIGFNRQNAR